MTDIWTLSEMELEVLARVDPFDDDFIDRLYKQFHQDFESDIGRDWRELQKLVVYYKEGSTEYRQGMDRVLVTLTGYKFATLVRRALGEDVS